MTMIIIRLGIKRNDYFNMNMGILNMQCLRIPSIVAWSGGGRRPLWCHGKCRCRRGLAWSSRDDVNINWSKRF